MRLPFSPRLEFVVEQLRLEDAEAVASLHEEDFERPWSAEEFASLLAQDTVFGFCARAMGRAKAPPAGFVLARLAGGEGEILTLAVARSHRGQGLGRQLMEAVMRRLYADRAEVLFLEVDERNRPAIALYRRLGFAEVGRRPGYYRDGQGARSDALLMRRGLR
jgi:ribosomal-protein-alanine N-acetyltransferase